MDHFRGSSLPDKIKHLATQKMRARTLRNSMILNTSSVKEANLTQKVIKYETFLSHQMINKIKTQDLKMFESEVKEVCKQQQSVESCKSEDKRFGISRFL
jgi:predicted ATPase